ncbi:MAG: hypothetical protein P4L86_29555 [Mycobacterium sp.]|nr:hypothetical protein [Mycobacterium sp.]
MKLTAVLDPIALIGGLLALPAANGQDLSGGQLHNDLPRIVAQPLAAADSAGTPGAGGTRGVDSHSTAVRIP